MTDGTPVRLRRARREDAPALAGLMGQLGYPTTPTHMDARLAAILAQADYYTALAEVGDRAVGMVGARRSHFYERDGSYGQILALVVDQAFRGRQIGALLVADAEGWLWSQGSQTVVVNSGQARTEAHRFYQRHGYGATRIRFVKELTSA